MKSILKIGVVLVVAWLAWRFFFGRSTTAAPAQTLELAGLDLSRLVSSTPASSTPTPAPAACAWPLVQTNNGCAPRDPYGVFKVAPPEYFGANGGRLVDPDQVADPWQKVRF